MSPMVVEFCHALSKREIRGLGAHLISVMPATTTTTMTTTTTTTTTKTTKTTTANEEAGGQVGEEMVVV